MSGPLVVRADDDGVPALLTAGWVVRHRSWGARLRDPDVELLRRLVRRAEGDGFRIVELDAEQDGAVLALEAAVRPDYPGGPATAPPVRTAGTIAEDRRSGTRWFGAFQEDRLVAATSIRAGDLRAETDTTLTDRAFRRRGLAEAVKAASVLALLADGATEFGTGGADENAGSLAMNARLGYVITERWLTLVPLEV